MVTSILMICISNLLHILSLSSANKFWSGLLESYYLPRASSYFNRLSRSLTENENFELEDWRREWILYSNNWQEGTGIYPVKAKGDALAISKLLYQKYFSWKAGWFTFKYYYNLTFEPFKNFGVFMFNFYWSLSSTWIKRKPLNIEKTKLEIQPIF